jgi:hypothetical protein
MSSFMKIRLMGAELLHTDRQTVRHEANSPFSQFCASAYNDANPCTTIHRHFRGKIFHFLPTRCVSRLKVVRYFTTIL